MGAGGRACRDWTTPLQRRCHDGRVKDDHGASFAGAPMGWHTVLRGQCMAPRDHMAPQATAHCGRGIVSHGMDIGAHTIRPYATYAL